MKKIAALFILSFILIAPSISQAGDWTKIAAEKNQRRLQIWINRSAMPTPYATINVFDGKCGYPNLRNRMGCATLNFQSKEGIVWLYSRRHTHRMKATFMHEMGHIFEVLTMDPEEKLEAVQIMKARTNANWGWREVFADVYMDCSFPNLKSRIPFGIITKRSIRKTCGYIRRLGIYSYF